MATVTIRDVARKAGVGVGTVSRVINDSEAVSEATRQKVLAAIEALDYTPHEAARRLSIGRTMTIGVIVPFFTSSSYFERLRGVEAVLSRSDYDLALFNAETVDQRNSYFRHLARRERLDGLLIVSHCPPDDAVDRFLRAEIPVVLLDSYHPQLSRVVIDNVQAAYQATRHLIELGHTRIGFVSPYLETPLDFQSVRDRYLGYYQALEEADLPFVASYHRQGEPGRRAAHRLCEELLELEEPPTAVFAYNDTQAVGVIETARALGMPVPDVLSVVGFDDLDIAEFWNLTSVRQPLYESGQRACQLLLGEMTDGTPAEPQEIMLEIELVERGSTAPPDLSI